MECRRWVRGPDTYHPEIDCACFTCEREERRSNLIDELEVTLRRPIVQLLDAGHMPNDIADLVRSRVPKKSKAWVLVRVELTHQAGSWLSNDDWSEQLAQVDQLAKYTGFKVGLTIPGWLHEWATRRMYVEDRVLTDSVGDVWHALADQLEASASFARPEARAWDLVAGRSSPGGIVVQFPRKQAAGPSAFGGL